VAGEDRRIVLHPGFVKTATTSLQRNVFACHSGIFHLGRPAPTPELERAIHAIAHADGTVYDGAAVARTVARALAEAPAGRTVVLSNENFALYEATDRAVVAERLATLFPDATVLFTIRRQQDLLPAWYLQKLEKYLKGGHRLDFATWLAIKRREPHRSILSDLDFWPVIRHYARLFGEDRIRVLMFEDLVRDADGFAAALAGVLQVDAREVAALLKRGVKNPTITREYYGFFRLFGRRLPPWLARKLGNRMAGLPGHRLRVTPDPDTLEYVRALCAAGNAEIARRFGLDLAAHGYPLPSGTERPAEETREHRNPVEAA
jgi:hypothetical protein